MDFSFAWQNPDEKLLAFEKASELALKDYQEFWRLEAKRLKWEREFEKVHEGSLDDSKWFVGGRINACVNCLDRHVLGGMKQKTAIIFDNEKGHKQKLTYGELLVITQNIATRLWEMGVRKKDRVAIYMPMTPFAIASMLACARIGAIHTVVFGGFSSQALAERIDSAKAKVIITSKETQRKGHLLRLKALVDQARNLSKSKTVSAVLCFDLAVQDENEIDFSYKEYTDWPSFIISPEGFDAEHTLFILYTSGTTGKPKGIFHSTGGYLVQAASSTRWVFDLSERDVYWCTADIGWITGHSYVVYGPLSLGATIFIYDGALSWPDQSRVYDLIEQNRVSVLYTAPTAIRMWMRAGEKWLNNKDLSSLRLLGSVGEPINPQAWRWYKKFIGNDRCEIIDSWWQTETGAMMITPIEKISHQKPGSASQPFLGIRACVVDENGHKVEAGQAGFLVIENPWPSMARGIWEDRKRYVKTYFKTMPGKYFSGDGAKIDSEGDFFISGRIDDVLNVSGHRLGTAEIESSLVAHEAVAEAAVVGIPDQMTGQSIVAFITLMKDVRAEENELKEILKRHVKEFIGSFAKPKEIYFTQSLPKTRSGKIMRRLLRAKAGGEETNSDISTLDEESMS